MSENEAKTMDPIRAWREWIQENEKRWSDTMTEIMGDDRFAKGMGRSFQEMLHTHKILTDSMAQYLGAINIPSRSDVLALGDRIGKLEDAVASLEVAIGKLGQGPFATPQRGSEKPKRTRKPPKEA